MFGSSIDPTVIFVMEAETTGSGKFTQLSIAGVGECLSTLSRTRFAPPLVVHSIKRPHPLAFVRVVYSIGAMPHQCSVMHKCRSARTKVQLRVFERGAAQLVCHHVFSYQRQQILVISTMLQMPLGTHTAHKKAVDLATTRFPHGKVDRGEMKFNQKIQGLD